MSLKWQRAKTFHNWAVSKRDSKTIFKRWVWPQLYKEMIAGTFRPPDEENKWRAIWHDLNGFNELIIEKEFIPHLRPIPHFDFLYGWNRIPDLSNQFYTHHGLNFEAYKVPATVELLDILRVVTAFMGFASQSLFINGLEVKWGSRCAFMIKDYVSNTFLYELLLNIWKLKPDPYVGIVPAYSINFSSDLLRHDVEHHPTEWIVIPYKNDTYVARPKDLEAEYANRIKGNLFDPNLFGKTKEEVERVKEVARLDLQLLANQPDGRPLMAHLVDNYAPLP